MEEEEAKKISLDVLLSHPIFWSTDITLEFLKALSDFFMDEQFRTYQSNVFNKLQQNFREIVKGENWLEKLTIGVKNECMNPPKRHRYNGKSIKELIRAIRNTKDHYHQLKPCVKEEFKSFPEGFAAYWFSRFPNLVPILYAIIHEEKLVQAGNCLEKFYVDNAGFQPIHRDIRNVFYAILNEVDLAQKSDSFLRSYNITKKDSSRLNAVFLSLPTPANTADPLSTTSTLITVDGNLISVKKIMHNNGRQCSTVCVPIEDNHSIGREFVIMITDNILQVVSEVEALTQNYVVVFTNRNAFQVKKIMHEYRGLKVSEIPLKWNDLNSETQDKLLDKMVTFQNAELRLRELSTDNIILSHLQGEFIHKLIHNRKICLFPCEAPNIPAFYINRNIICRKWLGDKIQEVVIAEDKFLNGLPSENNNTIIISDFPGMGKSTLLASMARRLVEQYPRRIVRLIKIPILYLQLRDLLESPNLGMEVFNAVLPEIMESSFTEKLAMFLLEQDSGCEFLFDGLDEVQPDLIDHMLKALKSFQDLVKGARFWVCTRPHYLAKAEANFSAIGSKIKGFERDDQINFLVTSWTKSSEYCGDMDVLKCFANDCLKSCTSIDIEMMGMPLQCFLLAELYMSKAQTLTKDYSSELHSGELEYFTVSELFKKTVANYFTIFMEKQSHSSGDLGYLSDYAQTRMRKIHMRLAVRNRIQQSWIDLFEERYFWSEGKPKRDEILSFGIIAEFNEKTGEFSFLHGLFGDYFVALFLHELMTCEDLHISIKSSLGKILTSEVLFKMEKELKVVAPHFLSQFTAF